MKADIWFSNVSLGFIFSVVISLCNPSLFFNLRRPWYMVFWRRFDQLFFLYNSLSSYI